MHNINKPLNEDHASATKLAADFLRNDSIGVITPEMSLDEALQLFLLHQGERLPVVESIGHPTLLGVAYKTSLLDAYFRLNRADFLDGSVNI
jgi:CIC family chloride channel protein